MREREAKLVVPHDFDLPPARALAEGGPPPQTEAVTQHAVYYDTSDLRLTRSGVSLRYRSDDGWTVKLPEARTASTLTRSELTFGGDRGAPPAPARSLVRAYARTRPLVEIAKIETRRRKTKLLDAGGDLLAEIDDDDVTGTSADGRQTQFREIEVELGGDTADSFLDDVVHRLRKAGARPSRATSKIARVLGDAADRPPDVPAPSPRPRRCDRRRPRAGRDRALVAATAELRPRGPTLGRFGGRAQGPRGNPAPPKRPAHVSAGARARGGANRCVRSCSGSDARSERSATRTSSSMRSRRTRPRCPTSTSPPRRSCDAGSQPARRRDREALLETLDSDRYVELLDQLVAAAGEPRFRDGAAEQPARAIARRLVAKPRKRFERHAARPRPTRARRGAARGAQTGEAGPLRVGGGRAAPRQAGARRGRTFRRGATGPRRPPGRGRCRRVALRGRARRRRSRRGVRGGRARRAVPRFEAGGTRRSGRQYAASALHAKI